MPKEYTYFETTPKGGLLDDEIYETCAMTLGRSCFDIILISNKSLVLARRTKEPGKGLWAIGGRISWEDFKSPFQYASYLAKKYLNLNVASQQMHLLKPRFICLAKRPYPEVLIWMTIKITDHMLDAIVLDQEEQDRLITFHSKEGLENYAKDNSLEKIHKSILLDLWDELSTKELVRDI